MLKLDVCLETVFTDLPVEERIKKIAAAGYDCVEMWFHDCTFNGKDCSGPAKNFAAIAGVLKKTGVSVNNLVANFDHPGYFLDSAKEGAEIVREIKSPNLKLLYDIYHMQIMDGNLLAFIENNLDIIGHFHAAGVPGRHELFDSEVDYRFVVSKIEEMGYKGCFGLEYFPLVTDHQTSLAVVKKYLTEKALLLHALNTP